MPLKRRQVTRSSPRRMCVGCRRRAPVAALVRLRWTPEGVALGKGPGRGAWLCGEHPVDCLELALRKPTLTRALRVSVTNGDLVGVRARLEGS